MFINLTPKTVFIEGWLRGVSECVEFPSMGHATCTVWYMSVDEKQLPNGGKFIAIRKKMYEGVEGLPGPVPGTSYIVSEEVRLTAPDRTDLFFLSEGLESKDGKAVYAKGLSS